MADASRFDEWGIRAAEQLESSVGAWIALASFKRLFESKSPIRERAVLGALRCALRLGDPTEIALATTAWSQADRAFCTEEPLRLALGELAQGRAQGAMSIADAEQERRPCAQGAYAAARIHDAASDGPHAAEEVMFREAQQLALAEGDAAIGAAAAARRLEILEAEAHHRVEIPYRRSALAIAASVDLEGSSDSVRLVVARARLLSPGRFARAGALSTLGDLVPRGGGIGRAAAQAIARHIDAMGLRLTVIEAERALAGLQALREERARDEAVRRARAVLALASAEPQARADAARQAARGDVGAEELVVRARALSAGSPMASHGRDRFSDPFVVLAALGLDALGAMATDKAGAARTALVAAAVRIGPGEPVPAPLWSAVAAGLAARGELRGIAARLGELLVLRAAGEPPSGFLVLGEALAAAGCGDAAREALDLAARGREPGAKEALTRASTIAAWRAYDAGETARARELLLEARNAAR